MVNFQSFKVLVLGDFLLDTYTTGRVRRISPEAPVPIMEVQQYEERPGGAGNVALSLRALGGEVFCAGRIGQDQNGEQLKKLLSPMNLDLLVVEKGYSTPEKNRLIADSQQLMRIDTETISPLEKELEESLLIRLSSVIPEVDVVAISDYGKGFLTNRLISETIAMAKLDKIPVIVDPKGTDFSKYSGASILKPNLSEAYAAVKKTSSTLLDEVASLIFAQSSIDHLLITRSEAGMSLFSKDSREDYPVVSRQVKDVTGAGDTVLAVLCLCIANRLNLADAVRFANIAAGIAIERLGCVQITLSEILTRYLKNETKIIEKSFAHAQEKDYSLFILSKDQPLTMEFFKKMRASSHENLAYISDTEKNEEFVDFLASFNEIGSIICQKETLKAILEKKAPRAIHLWQKGKFVQLEYAKKILYQLLNL